MQDIAFSGGGRLPSKITADFEMRDRDREIHILTSLASFGDSLYSTVRTSVENNPSRVRGPGLL
jgi:hypothetical protein